GHAVLEELAALAEGALSVRLDGGKLPARDRDVDVGFDLAEVAGVVRFDVAERAVLVDLRAGRRGDVEARDQTREAPDQGRPDGIAGEERGEHAFCWEAAHPDGSLEGATFTAESRVAVPLDDVE